MKLSIVTSMYRMAPYVEEFYARVKAEAEKITNDYEIIFVNDGSPDRSLEIAVSLYEKDARVKVIDLSRNFGQHKAVMTGLARAKGDLVFLLDCDLEEEPELLGRFYQEMKKTGADVVYGVQETRKGDYFEKLSGWIFYGLFNLLSTSPIPRNLISARLMTKRYVSALVEHRDKEIFLAGLWEITGFKQVPLKVNKASRGGTSYNFWRKMSIVVNSITSFSIKPLVFIFYTGLVIMSVASISALYLVIERLFFRTYLGGWPSLMVSIWFLGGLTVFALGVIGIYLSRVFMEVKPRPYTIIKDIYERSEE